MKSNLSDSIARDDRVADARARSSRASCRTSATSFGDGIIARSSPANGSSRPPLKKYVTCAYFSVSAQRNCVSPARAMTSGKMSG